MHAYIYIYIYMYMHICTYMYTYIYMDLGIKHTRIQIIRYYYHYCGDDKYYNYYNHITPTNTDLCHGHAARVRAAHLIQFIDRYRDRHPFCKAGPAPNVCERTRPSHAPRVNAGPGLNRNNAHD